MADRTPNRNTPKLIGAGILSWPRFERQTDRYGTVLLTDGDTGQPARLEVPPTRTRGRLIAEVIEPHPTRHAGDWALGLTPQPLPPGTVVALSEPGRLIVDRHHGWATVGVRPRDGRSHHWLDPRVLYQLVDQTVRLSFETK